MLNCRGLPNKILFNLINTVAQVLSFTNNESVTELLINDENGKYTKIFFKLIKATIYELYFNIKKEYLINEKNNVFAYLYYLNYVFPNNVKTLIYTTLSGNISFIYVLSAILVKNKLIISQYSKEIFFEFCAIISQSLTYKRKANNKYIFNDITYKFFEILLNHFVTNINEEMKNNGKYKNVLNIFLLK